MADDTATASDKDQRAAQQDDALRLRRQFSEAYAALLGTQTARDFSRYTFEEALEQQIERIEGAGTTLRPNILNRIAKIKQNVVSAVRQTKEIPPENFREPEEDDVNKKLDDQEQAEYDAWLSQAIADRERLQE